MNTANPTHLGDPRAQAHNPKAPNMSTKKPAKKKAAKPPIKKPDTVREKTQAPYTFATEEIAALGKKLQAARVDEARIQSELDSIKSDYKAKLAAVEVEQNSFGRKLDDGFEMREAFAIVTFNDPTKGRKTYRHEEGDAFIREEGMTHADLQLPIFRDENGKDATATPPASLPGDEKVKVTETDPKHGKTPLGAKLNEAAGLSEAPKVPFDMIHAATLDHVMLSRLFVKSAKQAGWVAVQISAMKDLFGNCATEAQYLDTIAPHVTNPAASE